MFIVQTIGKDQTHYYGPFATAEQANKFIAVALNNVTVISASQYPLKSINLERYK